jgi:chemotaxis protein methyltransferase CheR
MIAAPDADAVAQLRAAVARRFGLYFPAGNLQVLADALQQRTARLACTPAAYLSQLADGSACSGEWEALAELVTVGETYFFRNNEQFIALCAVAVPALLSDGGRGRGTLNILSAGCSSGEEPYTMAMYLEERRDLLSGASWSLTACDVNPAAIARARLGSYPAWSLRDTSPDLRERWFSASGKAFQLAESIRSRVDFTVRNLIDADDAFWRPGRFEVIFCRNVLMYLVPDTARLVVHRLAQALVPGGYLFLGHAETLRGLSTSFTLCHSHATFYYRRAGADASREVTMAGSSASTLPLRSAGMVVDDPIAWIGAIGRSAQRVATLANSAGDHRATRLPTSVPAPDPAGNGPLTQDIAELIRHERFGEAGERIAAIPARAASDPLVRVLAAVVQIHAGEHLKAEAACRSLLKEDARNARARYLLALCREQDGDLEAAGELYRTAAAHDGGFAMPHVRLALLARRRRDEDQSRRSFAQALVLIDGEDEMNLALFGGGFNRQLIAELCRGQAAGGTG